MAGKDVAAVGADFTSDGTSAGLVTVASTTPFRESAVCWLSGTALPSIKVKIIQIIDGTTMKVRKLPDDLALDLTSGGVKGVRILGDFAPKYGTSDISAYTTTATAHIDMEQQLIYDEPRTAGD